MDGVIYYNIGLKCLVRLAVSVSTLVQKFEGNMTILADKVGYEQCERIARFFGIEIKQADFPEIPGKNIAFLNKCRMHEITPYERTIFLDSDTIVFKDFSECFSLLDNTEFIVPQFANWPSTKRAYKKRIAGWEGKIPERLVRHAFDEPKAVNIGFYGWRKGALIYNDWFKTACMNQDSFIPDEIACQILLPHFSHTVLESEYNTSCKHEPLTEDSKILHYHGKKHCRFDECGNYIYHSDLWYKAFDKIRELPFVRQSIEYDKMLVKHLKTHDGKK